MNPNVQSLCPRKIGNIKVWKLWYELLKVYLVYNKPKWQNIATRIGRFSIREVWKEMGEWILLLRILQSIGSNGQFLRLARTQLKDNEYMVRNVGKKIWKENMCGITYAKMIALRPRMRTTLNHFESRLTTLHFYAWKVCNAVIWL